MSRVNKEPVLGQSVVHVTIESEYTGQRVDNYLMSRLKGLPKSRLYRLLRKGEVRVNKKRIKPDYKLQAGDLLRVPPVRINDPVVTPPPSQNLVKLLQDNILLELPGLLVVNKPSGIAVHGGSGVNLGLIEALRQMRPEDRHLELVHRLDKDTSGCIMIARKRSVLRSLQDQLRERHKITKIYYALVEGSWPKRKHVVEAPLLKLEAAGGSRMVKIHPDGKSSRTKFKILQRYEDCTLVEAHPITGRTHQIRVHAQSVGCGLVGDDKYGNDDFNKVMRQRGIKRLFLHAAQLRFTLPGDEVETVVDAPLPPELNRPLSAMKPLA